MYTFIFLVFFTLLLLCYVELQGRVKIRKKVSKAVRQTKKMLKGVNLF